MNIPRQFVVAAAALAISSQARGHDLECQRELGLVQVDEAGQVVLGPDGFPVFTQDPKPTLVVNRYPAMIGIRMGVTNRANDTSVVTGWSDSSLVFHPEWTWYGDRFLGLGLGVGATARAVVLVPVPDRETCRSLVGRSPKEYCDAESADWRFTVEHEAGMAECRSRLYCEGYVTLRVAKKGAGSGTVTSDPPGIACGDVCEASFPVGTTVTLESIPDAGSRIGPKDGQCSQDLPCSLTLGHRPDYTVTAWFEPKAASSHDWIEFPLAGDAVQLDDVNASGTVLGTFTPAGSADSHPFLWRPETGDVTFIDEGIGAYGIGLNDAGTALIEDQTGGYWLYDCGNLRPVLQGTKVWTADLGNQGWIVGGTVGSASIGSAFLFDGSVLTNLGPGSATTVNGSGTIVGSSQGGAAVFTRDRGVIDLGLGRHSAAAAVTDGGLMYGEVQTDYGVAGFIRDLATGEMTIIEPTPPTPGDAILIWSGNDHREALLTMTTGPFDANSSIADLWSQGRMTPIADLADIPWWIQDARAINERGQIIVNGVRRDAAGAWVQTGALLTPKP